MPLKPQDLLVCLALAARERPTWTYAELAQDLGLSQSEANKAVERSLEAGLLAPATEPGDKPIPVRAALVNFLTHGVRHAFFASPGRLVRGLPTAHSAPPLNELLQGGEEAPWVWPDSEGELRGQAIEPLYSSAPGAARLDPQLYALLALTDALRCGRARERKIALEELRIRLGHGTGC